MTLGSKTLMAFMLVFITLTFLSNIVDGVWLTGGDETAANQLTKFTTKNISWFTFPMVFGEFFIYGLPAMIVWDYSFLDNSAGAIIRWILSCTVSIAFVWAILQISLPIIGNIAAQIAGGVLSVFRRF